MDNRYQYQPWYVKLYRQLRYRPRAIFAFYKTLIIWLIKGAKIPEQDKPFLDTRWQFIKHLRIIYLGLAHMKMQWYYTTNEVIKELKDKCNG